jgi:hypothetical protein
MMTASVFVNFILVKLCTGNLKLTLEIYPHAFSPTDITLYVKAQRVIYRDLPDP